MPVHSSNTADNGIGEQAGLTAEQKQGKGVEEFSLAALVHQPNLQATLFKAHRLLMCAHRPDVKSTRALLPTPKIVDP